MKNTLAIFFFFITIIVSAQKIINITHQAIGKKIIINYELSEAQSKQVFEVSLYCSVDNFQKPLRFVTGSGSGDQVKGSGSKTIIWDVLKERDELSGNISFEVKALVSDAGTNSGNTSEQFKIVLVNTKEDAFNLISSNIEDYLNEAKDLKDAFNINADAAFNNRKAFESLNETLKNYNKIYEKLNKERPVYEKWVEQFWKNSLTTSQFENFMEYTLGDVHRVSILTLTQYLDELNRLYSGQVKNTKKNKEILARDIKQEVLQLSKKLEVLEERKIKTIKFLN